MRLLTAPWPPLDLLAPIAAGAMGPIPVAGAVALQMLDPAVDEAIADFIARRKRVQDGIPLTP